ncbi:carbohydrate kinase [Kineosporia sp. R_H_3]|uniref:carbohydrate kinase family protein n=1 Tax=Kineosporia sp. R_H_3 TaxID=1961848 RepID=UPI0018EA23B5|nr:carbohydrate kinase [Kineosporia sp. R_H_3]
MAKVLVVGEALVDIVQRADGSGADHPGGSPANVALGLARLGRDASLLTRIGTDAHGRAIREHLEASGVHLVDGTVVDAPTSTATALVDAQGVATYHFDIDWRLDTVPDVTRYDALHTGSIAAILQPGGDAVLRLVEQASGRVVVTYDPNARPTLMGDPVATRERMERIVALADVVKVSDEDLAWLAPGEDPVDVAAAWQATGPGIVVVTRGGEGAVAVQATGRVEVLAPRIDVVDTVGAGDSFMSALVDHLDGAGLLGTGTRAAIAAMPTEQVEAMLRHAVRVAAVTCSRAGANPPTRAELDA